jgi:hypothetical protein
MPIGASELRFSGRIELLIFVYEKAHWRQKAFFLDTLGRM